MASDRESLLGSAAGEATVVRRLPSFRVGTHRVASSRRRKTPSVRLGGQRDGAAQRRRWWWRGVTAAAAKRLRGRRLRWLRLQGLRAAARALRRFYSRLLRDLVEAAASPGAVEARIGMETLFSMPALPISLAAAYSPRFL
ncbi:unnamed protein product [Spirodela intermedia]|uniref:Uncharacterized protein n=1 Tax=Spirodela intermedia TaxID=51605 RepID=A0A7I8KV93_SPIIN|nr:unnamed protein product [Spirodela intermedia]